ncbi:MAG TPA: tetratricopeptide repeat protein [Myxococcaceae bacterium]|nr:tetratricopeptide repeat protein [Myxococcaceae bacterium]
MVSKLLALSSALMLLVAAAPSNRAVEAFNRGEALLGKDRLDDAAAAYRDALRESPNYAAALNGLGSVLFKQGKRDEAITQFRAALQADPDFKLAWFNLGYAARRNGDFASAAQAYERYVQLEPNDPDGFYGLGESYRQLGDAQRAISAYEQYIGREKRPSEQKYVDRAREHVSTLRSQLVSAPPAGRPAAPAPQPEAGQASTGALSAQPQSTGIPPGGTPSPQLAAQRIADGDRFMQERKYREASLAYQDAANADPTSVEALFKLGNSYAVLGFYAQAIERWNRVAALTQDPAVRRSAQDNVAKAQAKMAQVGGGSPQAQGKTPGSGPIADSTRERARQAYEEGVRLITQRDYATAAQSLTVAIQLEPTLAVAYVARGSANVGQRRYVEAAADYQYALKLNANLAAPLYGLAESYRGMGRPIDARQFYERYAASGAADVRPELQAEARRKADKLR